MEGLNWVPSTHIWQLPPICKSSSWWFNASGLREHFNITPLHTHHKWLQKWILKKEKKGRREGEESYLSTCCLPCANRTTPIHWVKCQTPCSLSLPVFCFLCYVDNHTNHLYMPDTFSTANLYHQPHLRVFMSKLPLFRCWQLIKKKIWIHPEQFQLWASFYPWGQLV